MATEMTRRILWGSGTPRTLRAHWMLHELDLDYETRPIGPRTGETQDPEFKALNPREKIPVLQDGDLTLAESAAIVTYLGETYGADRGLVPPMGTRERAKYYEWCFFAMTELDAHTMYIVRKHVALKEIYGEAPNAVRAACEGFKKQAYVAHLQLAHGGPYILGGSFTCADLILTTCLLSGLRHKLELGDVLGEYVERTTAREGYRRGSAVNMRS